MAKKQDSKKQPEIKPLSNRVLVEPFEEDQLSQKNDAGIIIPDTAEQESPQHGKVIAVGGGRRDESGKIIPMEVKKGDKVIFSKFGYDTITVNDKDYYILKDDNVLAIIS